VVRTVRRVFEITRSHSAVSLAIGVAIAGAAAGAADAQTASRVRAEQLDDRIRVTVDGELFTEYKYAHDQKYPYFYPVAGPRTGESVTTESSEPWPHHRSLFFGADYVNGGNYWQDELERGQILAQETRLEAAAGEAVEFTQTNLWSRPGADSPFRDERRIRITAPAPDIRIIDFDVTLTALEDVRIRRNNHSLFAARMAPELAVPAGGTLRNAAGDRNEEGTFGKNSPWAGFSGSRNGETEGLAILNHPANRWSPPPWFTRDYGFFSPTPLNWLEEGHIDFPRGEQLRLRYRVVVHGGDTMEVGIDRLYREFAGE
jgi:hypothetical protein